MAGTGGNGGFIFVAHAWEFPLFPCYTDMRAWFQILCTFNE
jgi:hypothetical protein